MTSPTSLFPIAIRDASRAQVTASLLVILTTIAISLYAGHWVTVQTTKAQTETLSQRLTQAETQAQARHAAELEALRTLTLALDRLTTSTTNLSDRVHTLSTETAVTRSHCQR